jgi:hypothetical protein
MDSGIYWHCGDNARVWTARASGHEILCKTDIDFRLYRISYWVFHRVALLILGIYVVDYLRELTSFPNGRHDDQVNSTSQAVAWAAEPVPQWGSPMRIKAGKR